MEFHYITASDNRHLRGACRGFPRTPPGPVLPESVQRYWCRV